MILLIDMGSQEPCFSCVWTAATSEQLALLRLGCLCGLTLELNTAGACLVSAWLVLCFNKAAYS